MFNCGNFDCGTLFTMLCQLFSGWLQLIAVQMHGGEGALRPLRLSILHSLTNKLWKNQKV